MREDDYVDISKDNVKKSAARLVYGHQQHQPQQTSFSQRY